MLDDYTRAIRGFRNALLITAAIAAVCVVTVRQCRAEEMPRADVSALMAKTAALMGESVPDTLPRVLIVPRDTLRLCRQSEFIPRGCYFPASRVALVAERGNWCKTAAHEIAHHILRENGKPFGHDDFDAHRKVIFAADRACR